VGEKGFFRWGLIELRQLEELKYFSFAGGLTHHDYKAMPFDEWIERIDGFKLKMRLERTFHVDKALAEIPNDALDKPGEKWHPKKFAMREDMLADVTPFFMLKNKQQSKINNMTRQEAQGLLNALKDGVFSGLKELELVWAELASDYDKIVNTAKG
jgi:hypothetical protein